MCQPLTPLQIGVAAAKEAIAEDADLCFDNGARIHEAFVLIAAFCELTLAELSAGIQADAAAQIRQLRAAAQTTGIEQERPC